VALLRTFALCGLTTLSRINKSLAIEVQVFFRHAFFSHEPEKILDFLFETFYDLRQLEPPSYDTAVNSV
jgi:hypothetical protein